MTTPPRGADHIARALASAGVRTIFSLSGNQIMPIYDALLDTDIRIVHVRHENAAVFMAEAHAQASGDLGVAMLTAGPGFANGLSAMYSAKVSETPMLILTGDAPLAQAGQGAFQEMLQSQAAGPVTKASLTADGRSPLSETIAEAVELALSGRPGPVHAAIPFDLVNRPDERPADRSSPAPISRAASVHDVDAILAALREAERPILITGPNGARAHSAATLARLRAATGVPVIPMESPRGLRDPRLGAFAEMLPQADLIVSLGKQFDFTTGFGKPPATGADCRFVLVDADEAVLRRDGSALGPRVALCVQANPLEVADQLSDAAAPDADTSPWRAEVEAAVGHRPARWGELAGGDGPMHPVVMTRGVGEVIDRHPDTTLVIDGGEIGQWCQACLDTPMRIINGPSGAIGGSIPYAIGAKAARPGAPAICMLGDGTAGFHFMEFETAVRENLPFVAVIGNDYRWNAEHQIQLRDYGPDRTFAMELSEARYDQAAIALGGHGEFVTRADELVPALERALDSGKPACVNVLIEGLAAPVVKLSD